MTRLTSVGPIPRCRTPRKSRWRSPVGPCVVGREESEHEPWVEDGPGDDASETVRGGYSDVTGDGSQTLDDVPKTLGHITGANQKTRESIRRLCLPEISSKSCTPGTWSSKSLQTLEQSLCLRPRSEARMN